MTLPQFAWIGPAARRTGNERRMAVNGGIARGPEHCTLPRMEPSDGTRKGQPGIAAVLAVLLSYLLGYWRALSIVGAVVGAPREKKQEAISKFRSLHPLSSDVATQAICAILLAFAVESSFDSSPKPPMLPILSEALLLGILFTIGWLGALLCHMPLRVLGGQASFRDTFMAALCTSIACLPLSKAISAFAAGNEEIEIASLVGAGFVTFLMMARIHDLSVRRVVVTVVVAVVAPLVLAGGLFVLVRGIAYMQNVIRGDMPSAAGSGAGSLRPPVSDNAHDSGSGTISESSNLRPSVPKNADSGKGFWYVIQKKGFGAEHPGDNDYIELDITGYKVLDERGGWVGYPPGQDGRSPLRCVPHAKYLAEGYLAEGVDGLCLVRSLPAGLREAVRDMVTGEIRSLWISREKDYESMTAKLVRLLRVPPIDPPLRAIGDPFGDDLKDLKMEIRSERASCKNCGRHVRHAYWGRTPDGLSLIKSLEGQEVPIDLVKDNARDAMDRMMDVYSVEKARFWIPQENATHKTAIVIDIEMVDTGEQGPPAQRAAEFPSGQKLQEARERHEASP